MAETSPAKFIEQVKQETSKVVWPTRKETMISTAMVLVMVVIAAIFFYITDSLIGFAVSRILGFGA